MHMRKNIGDLMVTKQKSGKTTKTICLAKENNLTTNQVLARNDGKFFCKKSNGKSRHSTIHLQGDSGRVLQKAGLKWTHVQRKNDLKLRLKKFHLKSSS